MNTSKNSHQIHSLSEEFLTSCFISGLRNSARVEILAKKTKSLEAAMQLTRLEDEKELMIKKPSKHSYLNNGGSSSSSIILHSSGNSTPTIVKKLPSQEIKKRKALFSL